jgi:TonB-linked SusC/RagA family outer membrane protein
MNKRIIVAFFAMFAMLPHLFAQQGTVISGRITDTDGQPVIGAAVVEEGTSNGSVTDLDGKYSIRISGQQASLNISCIGYETRIVPVGGSIVLDIILGPDENFLEEAVVVGYGTQKRISVTGAISEIKADELVKSPTGTISTSIAGRIPGLLIKQSSGQPGSDQSTIRIRGISTFGNNSTEPLVIVDGIERSFDSIDPEEVESFTVLKDAASTAVYGVRSANGVILVTTKRGSSGPAEVSYSGNVGLQTPTRLPKVAGSYDYARFYNQALKNDSPGIAVDDYYKAEELQKYKDHSDPVFYPDMDWMNTVFNKFATQTKHNVNITGGTGQARYYISLGYFNQGGLQKDVSSETWGYNNQDRYRRINLRSNVDMRITPSTDFALTMGVNNGHRVRTPGGGLFSQTFVAPPNCSPGMIDGKYVTIDGRPDKNPLYALTQGIQDFYENHVDLNLEISQRLDFLLNGLSVKGKLSYDDNFTQSAQRTKTEQKFVISRAGDGSIIFNPVGEVGELGAPGNYFDNRSRRIYAEGSLRYDTMAGDGHSISGLLLANAQKTRYKFTGANDYPGIATGYIEFVGRVSYNYKDRYLAELNAGINGSEYFASGHRFGFFPAMSIGWVASNEGFFNRRFVSYLKFRASVGEVGNDHTSVGRFYYYPQTYIDGSGFSFGETPVWRAGYKQGAQSNPKVSWEKSLKQNYAVESKFFADRLSLNVDIFFEYRWDILATPETQPFVAGFSPAIYNLGKTSNRGIEVETRYDWKAGKLRGYIGGNYSFARNKILYMAEAQDPDNPQLWRTGRRVGEKFGYVFMGFFDSYEEIANAPDQFGVELHPGDVRYKDINGDNVINTNDQQPLQHPSFPEINYGISAGLSFGGFDLSVLFQGAGNMTINMGGNFQKPFDQNGGPIMEHSFAAWSETNKEGARYPRLSVTHSQAQNYYSSDLWIKDASYLRFKNAEIGYSFKFRPGAPVSGLRVYANAQNIFVLDKLEGIVDPENKMDNNGINYPQQRVFNVGLSFKF